MRSRGRERGLTPALSSLCVLSAVDVRPMLCQKLADEEYHAVCIKKTTVNLPIVRSKRFPLF